MSRHDGRATDELRPIKIERGFYGAAPGSVLVQAGRTIVLCSASVQEKVKPWLEGKGKGWITAEYNMLPGSTSPRRHRAIDGRTTEIQRLVGRSLRAVADLEALGERMILVDCDVLQADGGTRTLSITGALVAAVDAIRSIPELPFADRYPLRESVAAVSAGLVDGRAVLDLDYHEDAAAAVDMNIVMTGSGRFVEVQGTGEETTFTDDELTEMLALARGGIQQLGELQREALGVDWPWPGTKS